MILKRETPQIDETSIAPEQRELIRRIVAREVRGAIGPVFEENRQLRAEVHALRDLVGDAVRDIDSNAHDIDFLRCMFEELLNAEKTSAVA